MAARKNRWRNTIVTLIVLLPIAAFVIYTSFGLSDFECEVCMDFEGQQTCRTVTGKTELEGLRTGVDNACAILASGVTDTMRCQRTQPQKANCRKL